MLILWFESHFEQGGVETMRAFVEAGVSGSYVATNQKVGSSNLSGRAVFQPQIGLF